MTRSVLHCKCATAMLDFHHHDELCSSSRVAIIIINNDYV